MNGGNEMSMRGYASASGFIFALVALLHLIRLIAGWEFRVAGWEAPSWVSLVALAVASYTCQSEQYSDEGHCRQVFFAPFDAPLSFIRRLKRTNSMPRPASVSSSAKRARNRRLTQRRNSPG